LALRNLLFSFVLFVFDLPGSGICQATETIALAKNLAEDGKIQQQSNRTILLYVSAPDCAFCKKLEKEVLFPLIFSGEYLDRIILREIDWTSSIPIKDFSGEMVLPKTFLNQYNIQITPTLLFLDATGNPLVDRLLGYRGGEFYWYYLDMAIKKANMLLAQQPFS